MEEINGSAFALSALVVAGVEFTKRAGLPSRWAPLAALVWGLALAVLVRLAGLADLSQHSIWATILVGVLSALIASGVYSGGRALMSRS